MLRRSSNFIGHANYESNFPHKLSLTIRQVSSLCKGFANNSSANTKSTKTHKIVQ